MQRNRYVGSSICGILQSGSSKMPSSTPPADGMFDGVPRTWCRPSRSAQCLEDGHRTPRGRQGAGEAVATEPPAGRTGRVVLAELRAGTSSTCLGGRVFCTCTRHQDAPAWGCMLLLVPQIVWVHVGSIELHCCDCCTANRAHTSAQECAGHTIIYHCRCGW
jgi:hypothetical protein